MSKLQARAQAENPCVQLTIRCENDQAGPLLDPVQTTPEKLENALFFRLGLQSRKRYSHLRNLKTPALRLNVDGKHFENKAFRKR